MTRKIEYGSAGAAAIIFDDAGQLLIVKENYGKRRWSLPGGMIERGETPEAAALRETWEETGVTAQVNHLIGSYTLQDGFTIYVYRCDIVEGVPAVPTTGEIAEIRWAPPEALPMPRSNALHYAVPDALEGVHGAERIELPQIS